MPNGVKQPTLEEWGAMPWYEQMFYGKPRPALPPAAQPGWLTPRTRAIMETPEYQTQQAWRQQMAAGGYTPAGMPPSPITEAARVGLPEAVAWETSLDKAEAELERRGGTAAGWRIEWDGAQYIITRDPRYTEPPEVAPPISPWQEEQVRLAEEEAQLTQEQREWQRQWAQQEAQQEQAWQQEQMRWQQEQAQMQQQQWQQQFGWQQEQFRLQQAETERQYGAQLAAQPRSWLEYAAYTGEQPAVQPWMQPLMPQQYQGLQAGAAIPGFEAGAPTMAGLPQLTTPSPQLWGRMGPTAQQQFAGYRQARTGIRPEEQEFRREAMAPPGGRFGGMRWAR